jgi:malate/lactate dehydrogenase
MTRRIIGINAGIVKTVVDVLKYSPDTIIVVVSNLWIQ